MNNFKLHYRELSAYLVVTFVAICAYAILMKLHMPNAEALTSAAYGVIEGRPHWLAYQNRLLGPYSVLSIQTITGISFKAAWAIYHALTLQVFCILIFWILRREGLELKEAISYLLFILFAFLALQHPWFFTWDSIDLLLFTIFAYGIVKSYSMGFFLAIFFVGILNRESALFIAVYLMLNSVQFVKGRFSLKLTNPKSLITGLGILVVGIVYTKFVRHLLFVSRPDGLLDIEHKLLGNHIKFFMNLKALFFHNFNPKNFFFYNYDFTNMNFFVSIFSLVSFGYFLRNYLKMDDRQQKLLIMSLIIFLNILIFGILNETRMHFILLPFFLFLWLSLNKKIGL